MATGTRCLRSLLSSALLLATPLCTAQTSRSLPDIPTLMHEVEEHQKTSEAIVRNYLYHATVVRQQEDSHGTPKRTETEEADVLYVAGTQIWRRTRKDSRDLTPEEQQKESERIDKEIRKAKERQGKPLDEDTVTVSRFLELGSFGNARRLTLDGRETIAIDFTGNPKVKTRNRLEGAIHEMEGTVWVDEQDRALRRIEGRFAHSFRIGGGLVADIKEGSSFRADWTQVNGEVWLPASASGHGSMRVLLLFRFQGRMQVVYANYRKFKATATILPAADAPKEEKQPIRTDSAPEDPGTTPPPR